VATALAHHVEPNVFTPEAWRVRNLTKEIQAESDIIESAPLVTQDLLGPGEAPNKILLITSEDEPAKVLRTLAKSLHSMSTATFSKPNYLEIVPIGVDKAKALAKLAKSLGISGIATLRPLRREPGTAHILRRARPCCQRATAKIHLGRAIQ
jgi:hydroxymethylpyrimidine pyrophosphatase-like HAD family hydrolase